MKQAEDEKQGRAMTQSERFTSTLVHVLVGGIIDDESYEPDVKFDEKTEKVLGEVKSEAAKALFSRARTLRRLEVEALVNVKFARSREERELLNKQRELLASEMDAVRGILWHAVRLEVEPLSTGVDALGIREGWQIVEIQVNDLPTAIEELFRKFMGEGATPSMPQSLLDLLSAKRPS